jgi:hypothetical protein
MDRRHAGSETTIHPSLKRVPTEPDEAALLHLAALDDMKSKFAVRTQGWMEPNSQLSKWEKYS